MKDPFMYNEEKPIKQVINELLSTYKLKGKMDELNIWTNWQEIMGTVIAKNTRKIQLRGQVLLIFVESAQKCNNSENKHLF